MEILTSDSCFVSTATFFHVSLRACVHDDACHSLFLAIPPSTGMDVCVRYFSPYISRETPPELPPELLNSRLLCVVTSWETWKNNWYFIGGFFLFVFLCVNFYGLFQKMAVAAATQRTEWKRGRRRKQVAKFSRCLFSLTAEKTSVSFRHFSNLKFLL